MTDPFPAKARFTGCPTPRTVIFSQNPLALPDSHQIPDWMKTYRFLTPISIQIIFAIPIGHMHQAFSPDLSPTHPSFTLIILCQQPAPVPPPACLLCRHASEFQVSSHGSRTNQVVHVFFVALCTLNIYNVCDKEVTYDRNSDSPCTIRAPYCIRPKKSSIATKFESKDYYMVTN